MSRRIERVPTRGARPGMSLLEVLIALLLLTIIVAAALRTLQTQLQAFTVGNERMDLLQNFRFAADILSQDIRTAGMGVPGTQPFLIYAGGDVIAFNADYATNDEDDPFAIYKRVNAPDSEVMALTRTDQIQIPTTTVTYPDTTYMNGPVNSSAETIIFYFVPDSAASAPDSYMLMRQVNANEPELVARDLRRADDGPFFEYLRLEEPEDGPPQLSVVPDVNMPMHHSAPIHGSAADTGRFALIDDVRAVRLNFTATNGRTGDEERESMISRVVRMPNAGLAILRTCGDAPILGTSLNAQVVLSGSSNRQTVELTWNRAVDEVGGERDVVRYVVWRRMLGETMWNEPLVSIPAGLTSYSFHDTRVTPGVYEYAVAAQDCTPALSELAVSTSVTIDF